MKTKRLIVLLSLPVLLLAISALLFARHHALRGDSEIPRTFQVRGQVREMDAADRMVRIAHEEIPDYMPAMTMPFTVKDAALLQGLSAGDAVQFELAVTESDSWISRIEIIRPDGATEPVGETSAPRAESLLARLQSGEKVPGFTLLDQNNAPIQLEALRGKAVLLTFIYTRCPLPNFCPLMSANFADLQKRLSRDFPDRYHLLSVSIDPEFDRPAVLKEYASRYQADERHWSFATGTREQIDFVAGLIGLTHEPENGLISHDLRTALIGPDGRLVQVWKSNVWTPYEVQRRVGEVLGGTKEYAVAR